MFESCRKACGAAMVVGSVVMTFAVSAASGGTVALPAQDASATLLASGNSTSDSWDRLAGIEPAALPPLATEVDTGSASFVLATSAPADASPHATVIPLPPGIWTGATGLASLTTIAAIRKLRRR